jgi:hypothetical protein
MQGVPQTEGEENMRKSTTQPPAHPRRKDKPAPVSVFAEPSANSKPVSDEAIRRCAYAKWEAAGKPDGDAVRFWLEAEKELARAK